MTLLCSQAIFLAFKFFIHERYIPLFLMIDLCALLAAFCASGLIKITVPILISANIRPKNRLKIIANFNVKNSGIGSLAWSFNNSRFLTYSPVMSGSWAMVGRMSAIVGLHSSPRL